MINNAQIFLLITLCAFSAQVSAVGDEQPKPLHFVIKKFEIIGENPLSAAETEKVFEFFLGDHHGLAGIQAAAEAFERKLQQKGLSFFQVNFAPQKLETGTIKFELIQVKIDKVTFEGNKHFSEDNLKRNIPTLHSGSTPNTRVLSRAINRANQQPSKTIKLQFSESETGEAVNAKLVVKDSDPNFAFVTLNNTGNDETGNFRLTGGYQFSNLFDRDHNLFLSYTTSPDDLSAVKQYSLSYVMPFYESGGEVSLFLSRSDVDSGIVANNVSVSGAGTIALLHYKYTFLQSGAYKQHIDFGLDYKLFENDVGFLGIPIAGSGDVLSRPISLAYIGSYQGAGSNTQFNISINQNISGGNKGSDADYDNLRPGASADWTLFRFGFGYDYLLAEDWFFRFSFSGQKSSDRLISGEQFGIGGIYSVRGFDERTLVGDSGYQSNIELWVPGFNDVNIRPLVFFDYGYVEVNTPLLSESPSISISSVGLGLRWSAFETLSVSFDVAYVIGGAEEVNQLTGTNDATEKGDSKAHVDMYYRF